MLVTFSFILFQSLEFKKRLKSYYSKNYGFPEISKWNTCNSCLWACRPHAPQCLTALPENVNFTNSLK